MKIHVICKICLGFVALSLGFVGLLIPVFPTTPFVLLAVGCFSATPGIQRKILKIPFVREYYKSYTEKRGLSILTVCISLLFLWSMLILSAVLVRRLWVLAVLALVGMAVTIHILFISRLYKKREKSREDRVYEE